MGKAGKALRQVLKTSNISQSKLASELGVERPIVFRWFHEKTDPAAETVAKIVEVLRQLEPDAATEFISLYIGDELTSLPSPYPMSGQNLPESEQLNIPALSRIFSDTTNSYKYLFFLSLLDILNRRNFEVLSPISFQELIVEMLANAWYPHKFFKLSFGNQDKISQTLDSLDLVIEAPIIQFKDTDKKLLRKAIASQDLKSVVSHLKRYVPFRLLVPFVQRELKSVSRSKSNQVDMAMPAIVDRCFDGQKPLYRFDAIIHKDCRSIIVHSDWANYIEKHYAIVRGWAAWEWLIYMQKRNPNTPAVVNKLFMATRRGTLTKQSEYWKPVLESRRLRCVFSGKVLNPKRFSLDHYLPWSFVAHDQLWNLIPVSPEVNSSKGNRIPSPKYFDGFINLQHYALNEMSSALTAKKWSTYTESYVADLKITVDDLLNIENLKMAYESSLFPLMNLAVNQGFSGDWEYLDAA